MPHCGLRHSCCNARAAVRRARALELLESVHRPRMRAGLEVVPPTTGPGVVTLRKAQEFAERALGPRAPLGELKAAAVVRVRVPENLLAPRERRPPLRRAAGGAAQSAQHHQRCAQKATGSWNAEEFETLVSSPSLAFFTFLHTYISCVRALLSY